MPLQRSRGRVATRARRKTTWLSGLDNGVMQNLAAGGTLFYSSLNAAALALLPFTIVRLRGLITVQSDQEAADEEGILGVGKAVVSTDAVAIGISALPTPITDQNSNLWFMYETVPWSWKLTTSGAAQGATHHFFDSKGMRKVEDGQDIVMTVENWSSAFGCEFDIQSRMLIKLH